MSHKLIVNDGKRQRELPLVATLVVGRDPACDISEADPLLSRRHVEFVADAGEVVVRDLASRNGMLINGVKLTQGILHGGDVIQVGHLQVTFVEDSVPLATPPDPEVDADETAMVPLPTAREADASLLPVADSPTLAVASRVSNAPTLHTGVEPRPTAAGSKPSAGTGVSSVVLPIVRTQEPADPPRPGSIGVELAARIVADAQYRVTGASAGCADLIGVGPDRLIGQYLIDAIPDQDIADGVLLALSVLGASGEQFFLVAPGTRGYGVSIVVSREGKGRPLTVALSADREMEG
ncbi:MAG: hypothetical protein A3H97_08905 [Acidobacteria bacterium RIFCSPLOWO2_02_FULL_65_29]|nr:MAG: hypothetical protein A3H97_08905 [Acidobacteria bacterium RIFCSPLOWO2_02_FULL_65_29]